MKEIKLTRGKVALVDDDDYERLSKFKWHANQRRGIWYAERTTYTPTPGCVGMHRDVLGLYFKDGIIVDHIDRDGLNNQKYNLRKTNNRGNSCNQKINTKNTSGFKGVSYDKRRGKWRACVYANGSGRQVGYFKNALEAAIARDEVARQLYGEYAYLNFI